jgi:hypothetical protein
MNIFTTNNNKWGFTIEVPCDIVGSIDLDISGEKMNVLSIELRSLISMFLPK